MPILKGFGRDRAGPVFYRRWTPAVVSGPGLDARYWWRNVREPVRFMEGVQLAMRLGARVFVEIGPGPVLLSDLRKIAERSESPIATLDMHEQKPTSGDPFRHAVALALSLGARIDANIVFGDDPGPVSNLPAYPWRRKPYRLAETSESTGWLSVSIASAHRRASFVRFARMARAARPVARARPRRSSRRRSGALPGAAFAEMALAVARDWAGAETATINDLEIAQPMLFSPNVSREILCRAAPVTGTIEIMSRARLSDAPWVGHAKAKVIFKPAPPAAIPAIPGRAQSVSPAPISARPRGVRASNSVPPTNKSWPPRGSAKMSSSWIWSRRTAIPEYGLDPARLDACFHGLILLFAGNSSSRRPAAYLPVRFGEIRLEKPGAAIARARIDVRRHDARAIVADFALIDGDGGLIARLQGVRYQAVRPRGAGVLASHSLVPISILADEPTAIPHDPPLSLSWSRRRSQRRRPPGNPCRRI